MPPGRYREKMTSAVKDYVFSLDTWRDRFPITRWLPKYRPNNIINDVIAGLTVGLTVIPQGLAYANIAKLPLVYGLYSAFMGCFVYCIFGMSKDVTVGPTAIMSLLVADYGRPLSTGADLNDPTYAVLLAFFAGVIQIAMGILHLGFVTNYISSVVISGFTSASAVTIGFGQIKNMLGIQFHSDVFTYDFLNLVNNIGETSVTVVTYTPVTMSPSHHQSLSESLHKSLSHRECGVVGVSIHHSVIVIVTDVNVTFTVAIFIFMIVNERLYLAKNKSQHIINQMTSSSPWLQKAKWKALWILGTGRNAVVVVLASGVSFTLDNYGYDGELTITGNVSSGLPSFAVPDFQADGILTNLRAGLAIIPLIGFLESIAIAKGFARQNGYRVESNQELICLGFCNLGGSFASAYPVTGSFSRSAINSQSSVATPLGGVFTGGLVLFALAFLTPAFNYIPKAALAAVIIFSVVFMFDYQIAISLWRINKFELLTLMATFLPSLHLGVEYGTIIGIGVDLLMLTFHHAKPSVKVDKTNTVPIVCYKEGLRYPASDPLQTLLDREITTSIVLDMNYINRVDFTIVEGLRETAESFNKRGKRIAAANVRPAVRRMLNRAGIEHLAVYDSVEAAVQSLAPIAQINLATDPDEMDTFDSVV
ncbi:sodium-independent sulfate anion transporter-like isoform X1 [Asterias amurensis]|uniref:sodium-independent sulfate anion transporter-like isoform X1 n=1 Tax=Asterias amurensis TaxID=7602 RepID=UPI003AB64983